MHEPPPQRWRAPAAQQVFERAIFASRWLLAPFYLGLALSLGVLLVKFAQETFVLLSHALLASGTEVVMTILSLIDLSLLGNLLLMVMFAGYETFVSRLDTATHQERLAWMGQIGFGDIKLKLMASIVAISAIYVLEEFMNVQHVTNREFAWLVGIHMAFVASGLLLALMDRLSGREPH
ncbi:MAG TPA: TIGR00645 family protein [Acetobacteraceae bacterium]|nr:TIGR00645 family protein [Acetobacteraceae bacterium]